MAFIDVIHLASLTDSSEDSGTDSSINIIVNDGTERLNHIFSDTPQHDLERGQANLYKVATKNLGIDSAQLRNGSIRVGILGDDAWKPRLLFAWGRQGAPLSPVVVPLAIEIDISTVLSVHDTGAVPSMPLRIARVGTATTPIRRLMLVSITGSDTDSGPFSGSVGDPGGGDHGTDNDLQIQVVARNSVVVQHIIRDTAQEDLESGQANLYLVPVAVTFTREEMKSDAIRLSITGNDAWIPTELYIFGLNTSEGRPDLIVPLVHEEAAHDGRKLLILSTDDTEGKAEVTLPLLPASTAGSPTAASPIRRLLASLSRLRTTRLTKRR